MYVSLVEKGQTSLLDALVVGATVEDLDIKDLNNLLKETTNQDIILVYGNLVKGSRNHMRSFNKQITLNGGSYDAQYISQAEADEILKTEQERGAILDDNSSVISGFQNQFRRMQGQAAGAGQGAGLGQGRGLGQGTYSGSRGRSFSIKQQGNRMMMESNGRNADCPLCANIENQGNMFNARLSNGRNAEIKMMPDTAAETALQRLRLRNCNENCSIELKEVGQGQQTRAAYELKTQRNSKVLGMFPAKMNVQAQVDAETGELVKVNKPWWAFLATEAEE